MFVHVHQTESEEVVRAGEGTCRGCGQHGILGLIQRTRTTTVMLVFKSKSGTHHLLCSSCRGYYPLGKRKLRDLDLATVSFDELMGRAGRREFPFMIVFLFAVWLLLLPAPIFNLLLAWYLHSYSRFFASTAAAVYRWLLRLSILATVVWAVVLGWVIATRRE